MKTMGSGSRVSDKPVLLLDAYIYIFQYHFSLPDNWFSEEGYATGAVYGYTSFLLRLLEQQQPTRIAACFDQSLGSCFRNDIYPDYKISRPPADEALKFQLDACHTVTQLLGINSLASKTFEADDLLGALCKKLRRNPAPIAILTRDKDLGQLILREQDYLWDYARNRRFYRQHIQAKFGVAPEQLVDYLALVGDSIDDIPGVPGVGRKTAAVLLQHHTGIEQIFMQLDKLHLLPIRGAKTLADKLRKHREQIDVARQLARIVDKIDEVDEVDGSISLSDLNWHAGHAGMDQLSVFCERMGFPRLHTRMQRVLAG